MKDRSVDLHDLVLYFKTMTFKFKRSRVNHDTQSRALVAPKCPEAFSSFDLGYTMPIDV